MRRIVGEERRGKETDECPLTVKLMGKNLTPLKFVCFSLELQMEVFCEQNHIIPAKTKRQFLDLLISWVSCVL
jgi:hypothetical protein